MKKKILIIGKHGAGKTPFLAMADLRDLLNKS